MRNYDEVKAAVDETVAEFGAIDIAVHNACKCTFESERETDFDTYKDVFDVNYFGALRLVKCVIPYMTAQKKGRVIFRVHSARKKALKSLHFPTKYAIITARE